MSSYDLRPYQTEILNTAREDMKKGIKNILIQSPTGSGKTLLTAHMLKTASGKGVSSIFIVHRRELVKQSTRSFSNVGVEHGIIAAGFKPNPSPLVQIASVGSLPRRLHLIGAPKLVIWDECHHTASKTWAALHAQFPDAFHIGLSATPQRLDGKGLGKWFSKIIHGPSVRWLIENEFLAKYKLFAPPGISTEGIKNVMGEFDTHQLLERVDIPVITGDAVREYTKLINGKRAVVFCISVGHSKRVAAAFILAGISAAHVDGDTPKKERDAILQKFEDGEIKVLSNVALFGEGLDIPAIEAVIDLSPTQSLTNWLQRCGRALRPGKEFAYIIDHAGNFKKLGLPDDEREWNLKDRPKGASREQPEDRTKSCDNCFAVIYSAARFCAHCGFIFKIDGREAQFVEGTLAEVNPAAVRIARLQEQSACKDYESLVELGRRRGYKAGWAYWVWKTRKNK